METVQSSNAASERQSTDAPAAMIEYTTLDSTEKQIKILHLHLSKHGSDELGCFFSIGSFDNPNIIFEALSYVWASYDQDHVLRIGDAVVTFTNNIAHVLQQFRLSHAEHIMWVDAICIHQSDLAERSAQVALTGAIYHQADSGEIWLDKPTANMELIFKFLVGFASGVTVEGKPASYTQQGSFYNSRAKKSLTTTLSMERLSWL